MIHYYIITVQLLYLVSYSFFYELLCPQPYCAITIFRNSFIWLVLLCLLLCLLLCRIIIHSIGSSINYCAILCYICQSFCSFSSFGAWGVYILFLCYTNFGYSFIFRLNSYPFVPDCSTLFYCVFVIWLLRHMVRTIQVSQRANTNWYIDFAFISRGNHQCTTLSRR